MFSAAAAVRVRLVYLPEDLRHRWVNIFVDEIDTRLTQIASVLSQAVRPCQLWLRQGQT
jgi:hypothetical protein